MADLITEAELVARLGPNFPTPDSDHASALITDASELVILAVADSDTTDDWTDETVPAAVKPVMASAVRRAMVNPDGFGSEMVDGYRFEQAPGDGVFLTEKEVETVRDAADVSDNFTSVELVSPWDGDL